MVFTRFTLSLKAILNEISVEPILVLYFFCASLTSSACDNLYLQKNCLPEAPLNTNAICPDTEIIAQTSELTTVRSILRTCVPGLIVTIAGTWRDRTGQSKPLINFSLCGEILAAVVLVLGFYFWTSPAWVIAILEGLIVGLTGGTQLITMATNCHVIENSSIESRTKRMAFMVTSIFFALMIASGTTGYILSALNYAYLFMLTIVLFIANLFLTKVLIKDKVKEKKEDHKLLNLKMLKAVFRRRENNVGIWSMILSSGFTFATVYGENPLLFLFLQKKFEYNVTQVGIYSAYRLALITVGSLVIPPLMNKLFKVRDSTLIIISALMCVTASTLLAFAETEVALFLSTLFIIFKSTEISAIKSSISKFLTPEEIGLYSSFDTISNAIFPLAFIPLYTYIFHSTLTTWTGAYFLLTVFLDGSVCVLATPGSLAIWKCSCTNESMRLDVFKRKRTKCHQYILLPLPFFPFRE